MSNRSSVHNKQDNTVYYLYGTSDHRFGTSWFWSNDNRFEGGLIAFLEVQKNKKKRFITKQTKNSTQTTIVSS